MKLQAGILGGGQLARMLALAAYPLGLQPIALCSSQDDPAAAICPGSIFGSAGDPVALHRFFSQVDRVVFENEFVDCELIEAVLSKLPHAPAVYPSLSVIRALQDKLRQKEVLQRLRIPSARHHARPESEAPDAWIERVLRDFKDGAVFKWARLGYDGLGTCIVPDGSSQSVARARALVQGAIDKGVPVFVEEKIRYKREVAIVACRSSTGEFGSWPLVITEQVDGVCKRVHGPAQAFGVADALVRDAGRYAEELARALSIVGVFAIELFETQSGSLCVNEIAPRVHNSGHFTLDASPTSQFENHWRAALGWPLGAFASGDRLFAMLNLLGPSRLDAARALEPPQFGLVQDAHLHWYGKREVRKGRKMGHINATASDAVSLRALWTRMDEWDRHWQESL